jgi:Family of unknown function (DUF6325)
MAIGPVEYIIVGFEGNRFTGAIVPELVALVDAGLIRILDLIVIAKDDDGTIVAIEVDGQDHLAVFEVLDADVGGIIGEEDIAHAAEAIEPGSSAALLIWEDLWAAPLVTAIRSAGGVLIEGARIPAELVEAAEALLADAN